MFLFFRFQARTEHVKKFANKTKSTLESLKQMRQEQPGAVCCFNWK